ncbi:MAG: 3-phosphoshikimate 1-carboxyvinyltransferase [Epsilonproteobacteria bacterium]|nr:3-phosphoshikimate 1-carboxyvinyltransferase [Campylobacterota bacterium]
MKIATIKRAKEGFDLVCDDIAADKSISHRCAIFSLLADSSSKIKNFLKAEDTLASLEIAKALGAKVKEEDGVITITPPRKIKEPFDILDCQNAGTAIRLYMGLLSGVEGSFVLTGDKYLKNRPMKRVSKPLQDIGAKIDGREFANKAPLHIRGSKLKAFKYRSPIDSAQVKSALILAALNADDKSYYKENLLSRDHTERMLRGMGAKVKNVTIDNEDWIEITPLNEPLKPLDIRVPADPSSGFFFAVAAAITPDSKVLIKDVTLNKTRVEAYKILKQMGADVEFIEKENIYEPIGDIKVKYSGKLKGVEVSKNIAWLIDELPALSIAMAVANGVSRVRNAKELRVKESDRISCVVENLRALGIEAREFEDGYEIRGGEFRGGEVDSCGDHRVAMSFAIAGILSGVKIKDIECVDTSFPNFFEILKNISEVEIGD